MGLAKYRKPAEPAGKLKPRITKQRRERLSRDDEYRVLQAIYLEQNPECVLCGNPSSQVHHVVRGTAGRARSLLNSDTWLGVCDSLCHENVEKMTPEQQIKLKQRRVGETIERLRRLSR